LDSALNQTYKNIEIVLIDDGSKDQEIVRNIAKKYKEKDKRFKYLELEKNSGKWNSLNYVISRTDADLITTLDADDVCLSNRVERQVDVFKNIPGTLHVLTCFHHCWSDQEVTEKQNQHVLGDLRIVPHEKVREMVLYGRSTPGINHYFTGNIETAGASAMFSKVVWDLGLRFNPPRLGLRTLLSEDSDFNFRLTALFGRTAILEEKLYCYRRNTSTNEEAF
jgi:glycosyltransferase involved in cell wall biosynthesis